MFCKYKYIYYLERKVKVLDTRVLEIYLLQRIQMMRRKEAGNFSYRVHLVDSGSGSGKISSNLIHILALFHIFLYPLKEGLSQSSSLVSKNVLTTIFRQDKTPANPKASFFPPNELQWLGKFIYIVSEISGFLGNHPLEAKSILNICIQVKSYIELRLMICTTLKHVI